MPPERGEEEARRDPHPPRPGAGLGAIGLAAVMVACCAFPALVAGGALGLVGGVLGSPLLLLGGLAVLLGGGALLLHHRRHRPPRSGRRRGVRLALGLGAGASALVIAAAMAAGRAGEEDVPSPEGGAAVGDVVPALSATTLDGERFTLPAQKPAVVYFMAAWCSTCIPEAQALDRIERSVGDRVAILAVDADPSDSVTSLGQFIDLVGSPRYGFALDRDGRLVTALGAYALDTTVVVDAAGRVVYRDEVPTGEPALRRALARAGVR